MRKRGAAGIVLLLLAVAARSQTRPCRWSTAEGLLARGKFGRAVELLERELAGPSGCHPEAWLMLSVSYQNLGQGARAVAACARGLKAFPASVRLQEHYGLVVAANFAPAEARARLEEAVQAQPDSAQLHKALGKLLFDPPSGDPKAGEHLAAAARLAPRDPEARYFYGLWGCTSGAAWADLVGRRLPVVRDSYELCLRELSQALSLTPADNLQAVMQIQANIGSAEDAIGRPDRARAAFRKALDANRRLGTPNPAVALEYARFLVQSSESSEAKTILNEILTGDPNYAPARFERARLRLVGGLTEAAIEDARLALEHTADEALLRRIHLFLARTYHELGHEKDAASHQEWFNTRRPER